GHATPDGTQALIRFARTKIIQAGGYPDIQIDWHGHNDRGHGVANALSAIEAGADRVHGTALGIGERCGNTAMDQLLVNLHLLGWFQHDLSKLTEYSQLVSEACRFPIPENYPVVGRDAFRTATGVHAAAIIKAKGKGDEWLADRVYSGVPAGVFGLHQTIEIGPVSGASNVIYWLKQRGIEPAEDTVKSILSKAKQSRTVLTEEEILAVVENN
ncbi:MAG TPA: 2-isopropylmalate synthase, partial [Bdellovibrionota bacterium]|nr:2-isopropylmalate synthase [Bdellovibrionota bacterium]